MKRIAIPVVLLIAIAIATISPSVNQVTANQQGPGVGDQLTGWAILCGMHGGKHTVDTSGRTVGSLPHGSVLCAGGGLDGLFCYIDANPNNSFCWQFRSGQQAPSTPGSWSTTGIDPESVPIVSSLPVPAEVANPTSEDIPPIVDAQVAWPTTEGAMQGIEVAQIHACTLGGGTATVATRLPDIESAATVRCDGGFLDANICDYMVGLVTCFTDAPAEPQVEPTTAPGLPETSDATSESTTPTEPMEPTSPAMPTEATEPRPTTVPTDEPVIEPTAPPATESDPWTVPEGTLPAFEPAEPTPTEVILL
jgi:cell division septation protein DedD